MGAKANLVRIPCLSAPGRAGEVRLSTHITETASALPSRLRVHQLATVFKLSGSMG